MIRQPWTTLFVTLLTPGSGLFKLQGKNVLLHGLQLLEEIHERRRIVSRFVHVLQPQQVCFRLEAPGKREKAQRYRQPGVLPDSVAGPATGEDQRNGGEVGDLAS